MKNQKEVEEEKPSDLTSSQVTAAINPGRCQAQDFMRDVEGEGQEGRDSGSGGQEK